MLRRHFTAFAAAGLALVIFGSAVMAHHGWSWTEDGEFKLVGVIQEVRLGNPHGRVTVDADGETWLVEVGQPWRNERAGLTDSLLSKGTEMTSIGHRSADAGEKRMKAERIIIAGKEYVLYPDRD